MMALSIALHEADCDKLVAAVEEFAETRAPLFKGATVLEFEGRRSR